MAFDSTVDFVAKILQARQDALLAGQPIPWSTANTDSYDTLITRGFDRTDENQAWKTAIAARNPPTPGAAGAMSEQQLMATQLKVGWMAGLERDMRTQFVASQKRGRTSIDQTRYAAIDTILARMNLLRFQAMIKKRMSIQPPSGS